VTVGGWNPLPAVVGGQAPPLRQIYVGLAGALGGQEGGAVGPSFEFGGQEDLWRFARAMGLAAAATVQEAAASELFIDRATYNLPLWEDSLKIARRDVIEAERADAAAAMTARVSAVLPRLQDALRAAYHPGITVELVDRDEQIVATRHRWLGDRTGVVGYGERPESPAPALSSSFVLRVIWPVVPLTQEQLGSIRRTLRSVLPAWWRADVQNQSASGFVLGDGSDGSLLGQRALGW
jgi:hypothetical protein